MTEQVEYARAASSLLGKCRDSVELYETLALEDVMRAVGIKPGEVDLVATQFSYANWMGNAGETDRRKHAALRKLESAGTLETAGAGVSDTTLLKASGPNGVLNTAGALASRRSLSVQCSTVKPSGTAHATRLRRLPDST